MEIDKPTFVKALFVFSITVLFLDFFGFDYIILNKFSAILISLFGLLLFFFSITNNESSGVFWGVIIHILGITLFCYFVFDLVLFQRNMFSILLIILSISIGAVAITKTEWHSFLFGSVLLMVASLLISVEYNNFVFVKILNRMVYYFLNYWSVILFLVSVNYLIKLRSSSSS